MAPPSPQPPGASTDRQALRRRLLAERTAFASSPQVQAAQNALNDRLAHMLAELEPGVLGLYLPVRGEFNPIAALDGRRGPKLPLALPFARRRPPEMHYRAWDGAPPASIDECGLPAPSAGPALVPDVVLVPCVAFTRSGYRLGYGGGYFDRWLAQNPGVTAVGIAWSQAEIDDSGFAPQPHDRPLTLILTEQGIAG